MTRIGYSEVTPITSSVTRICYSEVTPITSSIIRIWLIQKLHQ